MKIYPTQIQKQKLENIFNVHRYVFNRTLEYIKHFGYEPNFQSLRNLLATERTKSHHSIHRYYQVPIKILKEQFLNEKDTCVKDNLKLLIDEEERLLKDELKQLPFQKNFLIQDFELSVSNEIRSNAIKSVCDAYTSGFSNFNAGNFKFFNINFKKKNEFKKCIELASSEINMTDGKLRICPGKLHEDANFKISNKNKKKFRTLKIINNCDLVKQKGNYYVFVTVPSKINNVKRELSNACGGDLGSRTFLTTYSTQNKIIEYKHNSNLLKKLNHKLQILKSLRLRPRLQQHRNKFRKKQLNKVEKRKKDMIDTLHWSVINHLISENDVICLGDIKSHDIVKNNKNKTLNRNFNDLKFYIFKKRLLYKASINHKKVVLVNESYTTQGCSKCGNLWTTIGNSEVYKCIKTKCNYTCGRDMNASKNILMKGIIL
jgi:IS605 OrfB family transposase